MANTGYTTLVNGVETDLIKIFEPLSGTKLTYNTNYVTSAGLDLRDIFEPYLEGDATADPTKYTTISGGLEKDLNVIFGIPLPPYPIASNTMTSVSLVHEIGIYGKNVIATDQSSTAYYSTNSGKTFTRTFGVPSASSGSYALTLYGTNAIILVPGSSGAVYTSSNSGASWTYRMSLTGKCCSMYENYAMITLGPNIYLSNNYGASWGSITIANKTFTGCAISYDNTTSKYIAVCCNINYLETPSIYYCINFTGISTTTTFTQGTTNIYASSQNSISLVGRKGIACSGFNNSSYLGLWYTSNGGQTWTKSVNYSTLTGFYKCSLSATGLGIANRSNENDITQYITRDYGVTWSNATIFPSYALVFGLYNKTLVSGSTSGGIVYWGTYT